MSQFCVIQKRGQSIILQKLHHTSRPERFQNRCHFNKKKLYMPNCEPFDMIKRLFEKKAIKFAYQPFVLPCKKKIMDSESVGEESTENANNPNVHLISFRLWEILFEYRRRSFPFIFFPRQGG